MISHSYIFILSLIYVNIFAFSFNFKQSIKLNKFNILKLYAISPKSSKFQDIISDGVQTTNDFSDLPNSFEDSITIASERTLLCISKGIYNCRIDFDTSVGDQTYTSIKNTMPMLKKLVMDLSIGMKLSLPIPKSSIIGEANNSTTSGTITQEMLDETMMQTFNPERTLKIFFPDMGAAALARRDWKIGSLYPDVPPCVLTANIQNDPLVDTDQIAIILCPKYSEVDYTKRVIDLCEAKNIPCILINPDLINMDQGFGVRARNIRKDILSKFQTSYKLLTLKDGAIVRQWPKGYSLWIEDDTKEEGYSLIQSFVTDPPRETINELIDEVIDRRLGRETQKDKNSGNIVNGVLSFFQGLSKL